MMEKEKMERGVVELVDTESLVLQEHLLRKVDKAVDFRRLYEIVEPLYSKEDGRPSVGPAVLFKIVLLQHLDGIPSLRGGAVSGGGVYRRNPYQGQRKPEQENQAGGAGSGKYDEYCDCVICPEYQPLAYRTTSRDGYREYCSDPKICAQCLTRKLCTRSKNCVKAVLRHVWKDYEELADDARYTPEYKELYANRKETIERVFADAKEKHGMRYTLYRGLTQVYKWVRLKFAVMNLKKLARWKQSCLFSLLFSLVRIFYALRAAWTFPWQPAFREFEAGS